MTGQETKGIVAWALVWSIAFLWLMGLFDDKQRAQTSDRHIHAFYFVDDSMKQPVCFAARQDIINLDTPFTYVPCTDAILESIARTGTR